ncbi:MAG TPA: diguanylate phosphodiesterase, partial [Actinobacteria bacterium]|nr:diguanylate phosphodiesterase [Actinomycetota bacterium]
ALRGDMELMLDLVRRLKEIGLKLAIDDFGTGYSSLTYLKKFKADRLKIDQSFVRDASESEALRIVVQSSVEMARRLRVKSVAEGVETQKDWDAVKSVGCDTAQGYFIARPMAHDAFLAFCEAHSAR